MGRPRIKTMDNAEAQEAKEPKVSKEPEESKVKTSDSSDSVLSATEGLDSSESKKSSPAKPQKPGKAKPRSKKYQEVVKELDRNKLYPLGEAIDLAKKMSYSKINATLEAHINTVAAGIRGLVSLPFVSGKKLRILTFGKDADKSGADKIGDESTIEEMNEQSSRATHTKGKIDFDLVITTPDWMPKLAKVARILGPRGLMPNPKNGTIVADLKKAVESFQAGKTEYKTESKAPVIHIVMGKLAQPTEELSANIKTLVQVLGKTRVKKITLSPTMGPGVKVDLGSI